MNLRKLKFWSGMTAFILFAVGIILAVILRDILLPDDYGVITFDTYGGFGGIVLYLMILGAAFATLWIVLLFNDTDQPDILDTKTRVRVVLFSGIFSLVTGLSFYTDAYYLLALFMPLVPGFFIDRWYSKRFPPSLLRAYINICIFIGLLAGYIFATYLAWNGMWLENGEEPPGLYSIDQFVSILRIIFFIYLYIIVNFVGMAVSESRRRIPDNISEMDRKARAAPELKLILKISMLLLLAVLLIHLVPWEFDFAIMMDILAVCYALMMMAPSILKLVALYGKR